MSYYSTYRWCAVPKCKNTSVKTKDKLWIQVPTDKNMRKTWFKVARRDPKLLSEKSRLYFCEDHFDLERDMENYIQYKIMGSVKRIRLKQHCIPSKFDCNRKPMPSSNESPPAEAKSLRISSTKDSVQVSEMSEDITQRNAQNCKNYYRRKKTANQGVVKKKTNSEKCRQYRQRKKLLAQQLQSKNEVIHTPSTSSLQMTFVPQLITTECKNTSIKTPEKLWIKVPSDKNLRNAWLQLAQRDSLSTETQMYFCEDHFDLENDMENYMQYKLMGSVKRILMKSGCIPSRFECQTNRKRKLLPIPNEPQQASKKISLLPVLADKQVCSIQTSTSSFNEDEKNDESPRSTSHDNQFFVTVKLEPAAEFESDVLPEHSLGSPESIICTPELKPSVPTPCPPKPTLVPISVSKLMPISTKPTTVTASIPSQVSTSLSASSTAKVNQAGISKNVSCTDCQTVIKGHMFACAECSYKACMKCDALKKHYQHYVLRIPRNKPREEVEAVIEKVKDELVLIIGERSPTVNQRKNKPRKRRGPSKTPKSSKMWVDTSISKNASQNQNEDTSNQNTKASKASRKSTRSQNAIKKYAEEETVEPENTDIIKQTETLEIRLSDDEKVARTIEIIADGNNKESTVGIEKSSLGEEEIFALHEVKVEIDDPLECCEQYPDAVAPLSDHQYAKSEPSETVSQIEVRSFGQPMPTITGMYEASTSNTTNYEYNNDNDDEETDSADEIYI